MELIYLVFTFSADGKDKYIIPGADLRFSVKGELKKKLSSFSRSTKLIPKSKKGITSVEFSAPHLLPHAKILTLFLDHFDQKIACVLALSPLKNSIKERLRRL